MTRPERPTPTPERDRRPFVDAPVGPPGLVVEAAEQAAVALGLERPTLLRLGMNGVFVAGSAVLRVSRPTAPASLAYDLADVLLHRGVPVPRPFRREVVVHAGLSVTVWERLVAVNAPIDWVSVGRSVARVHEVDVADLPAGLPRPSPADFPWWDFDVLLAEVRDLLDPAALDGLRRAVERHHDWRDAVRSDVVVCHGDVHPGNVVVTADGPVLVDWDLLCVAPPTWDHAAMSTWAERWGGVPGAYEAFAVGAGHDARDDADAVGFATLRLVAATLLRLRAGRTDPVAAAEAASRLAYWRGEPDAPPWRAQ